MSNFGSVIGRQFGPFDVMLNLIWCPLRAMVLWLKFKTICAFFMAAVERRNGISESIMSILISTLQEPIVTGIVAALTDVNCMPSPNLHGFELVLEVILDCCSDGWLLLRYSSNQSLPHTELVY